MSQIVNFPTPMTPMVYVHERTEWEYRLVTRDLTNMPNEDELNAFGKEGWELAGVLVQGGVSHFYFKRIKD